MRRIYNNKLTIDKENVKKFANEHAQRQAIETERHKQIEHEPENLNNSRQYSLQLII